MKKKFLIWIGWLQFTSNSILAQSPKRYSLSPPHTLNTHTPNTRSYPHTSTHMHTHSTPHPRSPHTHTRRETCAHAHTQGFHSLLAVANPEPRVMPLLGETKPLPAGLYAAAWTHQTFVTFKCKQIHSFVCYFKIRSLKCEMWIRKGPLKALLMSQYLWRWNHPLRYSNISVIVMGWGSCVDPLALHVAFLSQRM